MKLLIIEDDTRLGDTLCELLRSHGYEPELVANGRDGLDYALSGYYELILLDVMLPGMDGFEIVSRMRREKITAPVLMLTARDDVEDKITGLDAGADDYLMKPFAPNELLARLRALSRRKGEVILDKLEYGNLTLNLALNQLETGARHVRLGAKEFAIMKLLLAEQERIVTKDELILKAWPYDADVEDNNVEVYISFLRKKLRFLQADVKIATVRKAGYHLERTGL